MSKRNQCSPLTISRSAYKKALRYALSLNEVGLLFFGKGNYIREVIRISNSHRNKRNRYLWNIDQYNSVKEIYSKQQPLLIEGHSHSSSRHLRNPSKEDLNYFRKGLHIIVFPEEKKIRCWQLRKDQKIQMEVKIDVKD